MDSNFITPRQTLRAYKDGFVGAICDEEDVKALLGELPMPVFGAAAYDLARPKGKSFLRGLVNPSEKTQKEEVEILSEETITEASELLYISICGYLLESQLADDVDKAHAIMENMSDTWAEEIIQNVLLAEDE